MTHLYELAVLWLSLKHFCTSISCYFKIQKGPHDHPLCGHTGADFTALSTAITSAESLQVHCILNITQEQSNSASEMQKVPGWYNFCVQHPWLLR